MTHVDTFLSHVDVIDGPARQHISRLSHLAPAKPRGTAHREWGTGVCLEMLVHLHGNLRLAALHGEMLEKIDLLTRQYVGVGQGYIDTILN